VGIIATLGIAFGSAWLSGINLYATVLTLGLLGRFAGLELPGDLGVVTDWWVIGVAGLLYVVEFVADKVPVVDSVWDVVHTFIRVPAGAVVSAAALGSFSPKVQIIALLVGGGLALSSHGVKASARAAINLSPEPVSNWVVSIGEDLVAFGGTLVAVFLPAVMLVVVAVAVAATLWLLPKIARLFGRTVASARAFIFRGARGGRPRRSQG
jgi:uncharacterized protein DUF4126